MHLFAQLVKIDLAEKDGNVVIMAWEAQVYGGNAYIEYCLGTSFAALS